MRNKTHINKKIVFLVVLLIATLVICGFFVVQNFFSQLKIYEKNWDIDFPANLKETYSINSSDNWFGEGYSYTIYSINENTSFFDKDFSSEKNLDIETSIRNILKELNVQEKNYPNFEHNYTWKSYEKNDDQLYVFYDTQNSKVYFIEKIL